MPVDLTFWYRKITGRSDDACPCPGEKAGLSKAQRLGTHPDSGVHMFRSFSVLWPREQGEIWGGQERRRRI